MCFRWQDILVSGNDFWTHSKRGQEWESSDPYCSVWSCCPPQVCWKTVTNEDKPNLPNLPSLKAECKPHCFVQASPCWCSHSYWFMQKMKNRTLCPCLYGERKVGGGSMTIFFGGVLKVLLFWQMFVTVLSHGPGHSQSVRAKQEQCNIHVWWGSQNSGNW